MVLYLPRSGCTTKPRIKRSVSWVAITQPSKNPEGVLQRMVHNQIKPNPKQTVHRFLQDIACKFVGIHPEMIRDGDGVFDWQCIFLQHLHEVH